MTNDMVTLASNWEDRLRPQKCDNTSLGYIFSHLLTLTQKEKKAKAEGNDYLQKTNHNWTKANEL